MTVPAEGVLNLLPTVPLGGPATVANRDLRSMRSFTIPWIPHDDAITPQDIQGVRGFGLSDAADPLATVMERKLTRMRVKHAQTREYMEVNALRGIVKDGAGATLYDYFSEFGLAQQSVDFVGATETLVPAGEGVALPMGTLDTFVTYGAPANLIETVNTIGLPMYARQLARPDGSAIEVKTEAPVLPVNKRPRRIVTQLQVVHEEVGDIQPEAVDAAIEPERRDVDNCLLDLRVVQVQVRLFAEKVVEIVLVPRSAPSPMPGRRTPPSQLLGGLPSGFGSAQTYQSAFGWSGPDGFPRTSGWRSDECE